MQPITLSQNGTATRPDLQRPHRSRRQTSLVSREMLLPAISQAFRMLKPLVMMRNPVMFVTEVGATVTTAVTLQAALTGASDVGYFAFVTVMLWLTVWFANFAEALAEARGKAQAASLRRARKDVTAYRYDPQASKVTG